MRGYLFCSAALALTFGTAAQAGNVVVYSPRVDVNVSAAAHQGPNVAGSGIRIINGAVVSSNASPGGGVSAGPQTPGATTVSASAFQTGNNGPTPLRSDAWGEASLDNGWLKARVLGQGPDTFGSPFGFAATEFNDTVWFNNTSGHTVSLQVGLSYDGRMLTPNGGAPNGLVRFELSGSCGFGCGNDQNQYLGFASGNLPYASDAIEAFFNASGTYAYQTYNGPPGAHWSITRDPQEGVGGLFGGTIGATLLIPTGQTSLGLKLYFQLDCRSGSSCFGDHTSAFSFGAIPAGLTIGSASGALLTAPPEPGVPEPASWAMMIAGFAAAGAAVRRRRAAFASVRA
jgi:hypothetical protein